jgi:hypothetical protein
MVYLVQTLQVVEVFADGRLPVHVHPLEDPRLCPHKDIEVLLHRLLLLGHCVRVCKLAGIVKMLPDLLWLLLLSQLLLHSCQQLRETEIHEVTPEQRGVIQRI